MIEYIVRRSLQAIPLLILISILCFGLMQIAPGGPDAVYAQNPYISAEDLARIRHNLGLDQPVYIQYVKWLGQTAGGNLGYSYVTGRPVKGMIAERVPATVELMVGAFLLSLLLGLPVGIYSAARRYSPLDYSFTVASFFGFSMPVFWFGLMMILLFSGYLGWLPSAGRATPGVELSLIDHLRHLVLPTVVLSLLYVAEWSRYMRSSLVDEAEKDYVRTAVAKGLSSDGALLKHGIRNALIPVVTVIALQMPSLFTGAIITETIFAWPGMGRLYFDAIGRQDYPVLMGILVVASCLVIVFNLLADILYAVLDPRITYSSGGR